MGARNTYAGMDRIAQSLPFTPGGKIFIVADANAAGYNDILQKFGHNISGWYSTVDTAINACTADRGDIILVAPDHTETFTAAAGFALDVAGVSVIGIGSGNNRPVFTISSTDNAGTITQSGNNTTIKNIVVVTNDDALTNAVVVSGDNCVTEFEHQDTSSLIEAATVVRGDTANNWKLKLKHNGFTGGNATVSVVRLDDCDNVDIEIDAYGVWTTAGVEMVDVASTNVRVNGYLYCSGITNGTRDVVDTITASTWFATIKDGSAGASYSGGSAAALAADDVSSVATNLATLQAEVSGAAGIVTWPSPAYPANGVSLAEAIRYIADAQSGTVGLASFPAGAAAANDVSMAEVARYTQENIINGAGTALPAGDSLYGVLAGATGITTFPAAAAPANSVSIAEVLREAYDQSDKAVTNTTATLVNGTTLFTIAGGPIEILSLVARCVTTNDGTASTLQWSADPTDGVAVTISAASASLASVAAGGMVVFQGTSLATAPLVSASGANVAQTVTNGVVVGAGIITSVIGVGSTTGTWQMHMRYRPLARGVTVS